MACKQEAPIFLMLRFVSLRYQYYLQIKQDIVTGRWVLSLTVVFVSKNELLFSPPRKRKYDSCFSFPSLSTWLSEMSNRSLCIDPMLVSLWFPDCRVHTTQPLCWRPTPFNVSGARRVRALYRWRRDTSLGLQLRCLFNVMAAGAHYDSIRIQVWWYLIV